MRTKLMVSNRYATSKLLEVFFARELAKRITESEKPKIIVNCMTPGACQTNIRRNLTGLKKVSMGLLTMIIGRTAEAGSRTLVAGIVAGSESHGQYMADCVIAE
jgi:NAD(P)-dependent dehydrogenase (short-subunit alcohol dehydrogenase family)